MKFIELAEKRCSIRSFKSDPVPDEMLGEVLEAGRLAPTAKNLQPFHFIVVRRPDKLDELAAAYPAPFLRAAPVVIVVCTEAAQGWTRDRYDGKNYCEIDAAIAVDHMTLAAADLGLGTCWIAAFNPAAVADAMKLPEGMEPVILLPLGRPAASGVEKNRKPLKDLIHYDQW
jgi:nitroreductase